jgi:hemoglobin-like flavoprotein
MTFLAGASGIMAITPRQVKTLTEDELKWIKSQFAAIDRDIFARYDGTHPLEIVLSHTSEHRAFVNEAFFRRAVSEYARCGWRIEDGGPRGDDRVLLLSDPHACAPLDISQLAEQALATQAESPVDTIELEPEAEKEEAWQPDEEEMSLPLNALEGEPGEEEEVETLWDPVTPLESEELATAQSVDNGTSLDELDEEELIIEEPGEEEPGEEKFSEEELSEEELIIEEPEDDQVDEEELSIEEPEDDQAGEEELTSRNGQMDLAIGTLEESFALLAPSAPDLAERFYARLFSDFPEVEPFFEGVDMAAQKKHLVNSLVLVVNNLRHPDKLHAALHALGQRHQNYGIEPEHYDMVAGTLLMVMEEFAGAAWTSAVQEAWEDALGAIASTMLAAYEEVGI